MKQNKKAIIYFKKIPAGILEEIEKNKKYIFTYDDHYKGELISLTMPKNKKQYEFESFPAFFDGLLPEGIMLESLLRTEKIDQDDYFKQLITIGKDTVGAVTIELLNE